MARLTLLLTVLTTLVALLGGFKYLMHEIREARDRKRMTGKWLLLLTLCLFPSYGEAACDTTTVQNQINAASSGDTVIVTPADCTSTWNTLVTIPNTKGITLDFNGAVITCGTPCNSNNSPILRVTTNTSTASRVTNVDFTTTNGAGALEVFMEISTSSGDPRFRLDHCSFDGNDMGYHLRVSGPGYGLIDHCEFFWSGNNEVLIHVGYGSGSHTGWVDDITPGSLDALYVEDSTFTNRISGGFLGGKTTSAYGAKIVYRFNTFNCMEIDVHGTAGSVGGRWWELYHNVSNAQPSCDNIDKHFQIRAGTGFIFNNTYGTGTNNGAGNIVLWEEDSGTYPLLFQIGRGKCSANPCTQGGSSNMALDPAYLWGNENPPMNIGIDEVTANTIVEDRDFYSDDGGGVGVGTARPGTCTTGQGYWETDEGEWWAANAGADGRFYKCTATNTWTLSYTPATYPHELQGVGGGGGGGGGGTPILFLNIWWLELAPLVGVFWHARRIMLSSLVAVWLCAVTTGALVKHQVKAMTYTTSVTTLKLASAIMAHVKGDHHDQNF